MRVFILLMVLFSFLIGSVDGNESHEIFLRLDTGGHTGLIKDIIVTKKGEIISLSDDKTIKVWDSKTAKEKRKILGEIGEGIEGLLSAIALSPNEEFLAVGGLIGNKEKRESNIRIYNNQTGKLLKVLKSHMDGIKDLAFSMDGEYLISGSGDNTAKIWSGRDFVLLDTIKFHSNDVYAVKIIKKNGKYFAVTAGDDNKIALYDIQTKKIIRSDKKQYNLDYIAISKNYIAVCGTGKEIQIYSDTLNPIKTIFLESKASALAYSPNEEFLMVATVSKSVKIYSVGQNYKKIQSFKTNVISTMAVAFLDNQTAISCERGNIYIWNIKNSRIKTKINGVGKIIWRVGIKGDIVAWGNHINYQSHNNRGKIQKSINLKNFQISSTNNSFNKISSTYKNYSLKHSEGGPYRYNDGYLDIKRIRKTSIFVTGIIKDSTNGLMHNCYGFYKDYIISGGANGFLKIYNLKGEEIANLRGHIGDIWSIALDGDRLISGGSEQIIKVWDLSKIKKNKKKLKISESQLSVFMESENFSREKILKLAKTNNFINNSIYISPQIRPQLSLFISKNNEYIAWTNEGYFNSSRKGVNYLYFHLNQGADKEAKAIPMKILYDHFNRPDLIKLKLAGKEEVYQKSINGITYKTALQDPPPTVTIKDTNKKTKKDKIKLSFNIKDNDGGVGLIRIYQEGKLIQTIGKGQIKKESANKDVVENQNRLDAQNKENQKDEKLNQLLTSLGGEVEIDETLKKEKIETISNEAKDYEIELDLIAGKNEIGIEAFNKTNTVTSYRETIIIDADITPKKPKLYAIVLGINDFEHWNSRKHLSYSESDAESIKYEIENSMRKQFDEVAVEYLIGKKMTKENILKSVAKIKENAKLEDTIIFYLSTHGRVKDGNLYFMPYNNQVLNNWIDFQETFKAIQSIKALNQIFIVDACESGKANDIVSAVYDSRASVLARSAGVHMLLATTRGASAFEPKKGESNILTFTQRVLKTMRDKSTDKNDDGFVSVVELSKALQEPQNIVEYQYPVIRNVGGDVLLERVE